MDWLFNYFSDIWYIIGIICSLVDVWSVMFVDILIVLFCVLCDICDYDRIRWLDYRMIVDIKW